MSAPQDALHELLRTGALDLPMPGSGRTNDRWSELARIARRDVVLGRLAEAHCDAIAILAELRGPVAEPYAIWGVWAAEPPDPVVRATHTSAGWRLDGRKLWCSGASLCDWALLTVRTDDGPALVACDLRQDGARPVPDTWHAVGMADSDSGAVDFTDATAIPVGSPGAYLARPGFWHGAIGVAACWFGGACGVADALHERMSSGRGDEHTAAHLGAVTAALRTAGDSLAAAAVAVDDDPADSRGRGRERAMTVRAVVEESATDVLDRVGRALGAAPLCTDERHARRVADLTVYLRQSHAERDLAELGHLIAKRDAPW